MTNVVTEGDGSTIRRNVLYYIDRTHPIHQSPTELLAQPVRSSAFDSGNRQAEQYFLESLKNAKHDVKIKFPYFVDNIRNGRHPLNP